MKKIAIGISAGILMLLAMGSCMDQVEEQYLNPEKTTEASIGKFFTYMIDNSRVRPEYWNIRTFLVMHPGVYTQSVSYINGTKRYQQQFSYMDDFWRDYYTPTASGVVAHMREIEKEYSSLSEEEKVKAEVYVQAAKVLYLDQTAQMVDLWGDIPFSEAGSINLTGGQYKYAKFDNAEEIYAAILTGLEEAADYFGSATLDPLVASAFGKQDILLQGNLSKWQRYANSLRLRALMRISFQNENKAQTDIMEMLNTPASYPLVDEASYNILLHPVTTYTDFMRNAVTELNSHLAPEFLLDNVLKPANDPRLRVLFDKNVSGGVYNADYFAMPTNIPASTQETNITQGKYAILDSATFLFNTKFPGIIMTSHEVNFIKAEAFQRWGNTADAEVAYKKGVEDAVRFSFYLNTVGATSSGTVAETAVTPAEISDLLAAPSVEYTGTSDEKLAKIWTQKWVSFGFIQSIQSWSELRRTKYPQLNFTNDPTAIGFELPGSRLVYPPNEKTYNAENYAKVAAQDVATTKIFWDVK